MGYTTDDGELTGRTEAQVRAPQGVGIVAYL